MNTNLDWKFYVSYYKDLNNINNEKDAINHWKKFGMNEKRLCNKEIYNLYQNFDHIFYLIIYHDLKKAGINDKINCFHHWLNIGKFENRCYNKDEYFKSIDFDYKFYISFYEDLTNINNENDAKQHWINYGMKEKRLHSRKHNEEFKIFDWVLYIDNYPQLKEKGIDDKKKTFIYYINHTPTSNSNSNSNSDSNSDIYIKEHFDWEFYKSYYKELNNINNYEDAYNHYLNYGFNHYYLINKNDLEIYTIFDWEKYINYYKLNSEISNKEKAYYHWNKYGKKNGAIYFFKNNVNITENNFKIYDYSIIIYYDGNYNNILYNLNNFKDLYYKKYNFEVIIIDNSSIHNLDNILDDFDYKIKYIYEYNNLNIKNIYQFFNKAVTYSNGKNLIFQHSKVIHYNDLFYKLKPKKLIDYSYVLNTIDYDFNNKMVYSNHQNNIFKKSYMIENKIDENPNLIRFDTNINNYNKNIIMNYNYCICMNKYYFNILEGFDETYENELYCFKDFLNRLNKLISIKYYKSHIYTIENDININICNLSIDKLEEENKNIKTDKNKIYKKMNQNFGIAISVYSDKDTSHNRILTSKICLNSIIKNFRNIPIIIVIDYNIENNHLIFIKELIHNKKNIELYINKENYGIAKTKNICIKLLENKNIDYICLLDDDIEILKDFSNYVMDIFDNINIPLLTNYNNELPYEKIKISHYNFIKTINYFGNFLIINRTFIDKYGYFAKFEYKWGDEHVEITNRYLNNTKYKNIVLDLSKFIVNEQIINGVSSLHLHSMKVDLNLAQKNKIMMEKLLSDIKYIPFTLDKSEIEKINY